MVNPPIWYLYFDVLKDTLVVIIMFIGLGVVFYAKKQLDLIKNQTKETREQFRIKNERESVSLAIELSEEFPNYISRDQKLRIKIKDNEKHYISLNNKYNAQILLSKNCKNSIPKKMLTMWFNLYSKIGYDLLKLANDMEAFAMYFVNGVADEKAVFSSIAPVFCSMVEFNYPILIANRCDRCGKCEESKAKSSYRLFEHTFKLYKIWKRRLSQEINEARISKLSNDQQELNKDINNLPLIGSK